MWQKKCPMCCNSTSFSTSSNNICIILYKYLKWKLKKIICMFSLTNSCTIVTWGYRNLNELYNDVLLTKLHATAVYTSQPAFSKNNILFDTYLNISFSHSLYLFFSFFPLVICEIEENEINTTILLNHCCSWRSWHASWQNTLN